MHHSEILIQLDRPFGEYITPAQMLEQFQYNSSGNPISIKQVTDQFHYLFQHNILTPVDDGFRPDDRFELSDYWGTLSQEEKDGWYSTISSTPSID